MRYKISDMVQHAKAHNGKNLANFQWISYTNITVSWKHGFTQASPPVLIYTPLKIYSFIFLGYAVWVTYQELGNATKTLMEKIAFLVPHIGAFSVVEAITIVALIQIWDIIMYLTNKFKANLAKIRAESRAEGEAKGRAEAYQIWTEWYGRQEEAKAQGLPFDEPPPTLNGEKDED